MSEQAAPSEYLVISRGQWDRDASQEKIQSAIDEFYVWHDRPFGETKEVIGGYWFILASSLEKAAEIAAGNPCLSCGLFFEVRPIEAVRASAFAVTTETPSDHRDR